MSQTVEEIDLKESFRIILRYKGFISFVVFIFLISSAIFAYYSTSIYKSNTTIEIFRENSKGANDIIIKALGGGKANIDNEISVLQSRWIVQRALEKLNLTTNYYSNNEYDKKIELYKDSPFVVNIVALDDKIYGKNFELIPKTENTFELIIKPVSSYSIKGILAKLHIVPLLEKDKISYDSIHKYGEEINTPLFTISINKIKKFGSKQYFFKKKKKKDLYDTYKNNLTIEQISAYSSLLNLTLEDDVALRAKEILNSITQTYIEQGIISKSKSSKAALAFIDKQLEYISKRLNKSAISIEHYKEKNNAVDMGRKANLASTKIVEYESKELELQTEINILTNVQRFINKNENLSGLTIGAINFADKSLGALIAKLQDMIRQRNDLLTDFTELHPEVQKLTKNIIKMKKSIKIALASNLGQLKQRKKALIEMVAKYNKMLRNLPSKENELANLNRPFDVNQKIYEYLLQKRAETAILKSSTVSRARILDAATENPIPIKPKIAIIMLIGFVLGLITGISIAFLREFLIYTIKNAEEVEKLTSIPIYGVIPLKKNKLTRNISAETFRTVRTNLQFLPGKNSNQIISITSSVSGEGKTTIVAALGEILAHGDKKVIALDVDLRKASLHEIFKLKNDIGMSNYLTFQNSLEEVIKATDVPGFDIITAGTQPPNPSELILSSAFTNLLQVLRKRYDYIIIDTPPAGLVTDAVIVMNYSDISLVIVRAEYTRKEFIKNIDRLAKEHTGIRMGIILNGTKIGAQYGYGYGSSYAYGYGNAKYYKNRE